MLIEVRIDFTHESMCILPEIWIGKQTFGQQAEVILVDGQLTKACITQLNGLQRQFGLESEYAQKIIKTMMTTKMVVGLETVVGTGEFDDVVVYVKILEDLGIDVEKIWLLNSLIQAVSLLR
ncbi:hypothetical protein L1887_31427 [Cichorium endivia]|nr:hypothetical protein L1887_31427 [Cichorium endivia]